MEDFMHTVFRQSPTPCLLLKGNFPHFTIEKANIAYLQINRTNETGLLGKDFFETLSDENYGSDRIGILNSLTTVVYTRESHQVTIQNTKNAQVKYWHLENTPIWGADGDLQFIMHTAKDVTETVLANQKREEAENRYSHIFHYSPLPMWVYEVETLKFLDVNSAAIEHYGYNREEFLKMTIRDIRPASEVAKLEEVATRSKQKSSCFFSDTFKHQKKCGELIRVNIYSNLISFQGKKAKAVVAHDITERLNYLYQIEKQNETLKEIAWIQSHVVRAPLARIMGCANLLANANLAPEEKNKLREYLLISANDFDEIIKTITLKTLELNPTYQSYQQRQKDQLLLGAIPSRSDEAA